MVDCADELSFPLFKIPEDMLYMDCIIPIFEKITQSQIESIKRNERIHNQLIRSMVEGNGLKGICDVISQMACADTAIVNPRGTILAMSLAKAGEQLSEEQPIEARIEVRFSRCSVKKLEKNKCNLISDRSGNKFACVPIFVKTEHIAYLVLNIEKQEFLGMDQLVLENASTLVAVELMQEKEALNKERRIREQLLEDLLDKRYSNEEVMVRRGRFVDIDFTGENCMFILGIDSFEEHLTGAGRMSEKKIQRLKEEIQWELESQFEKEQKAVLLIWNGMDTIGLVTVKHENENTVCDDILERTICILKKKYKQFQFSAGVGRTKAGLGNLTDSYKEAKFAINAGRKMNGGEKSKGVTNFEELGCLCFLCELDGSEAEKNFYEEYMGKIEQYDRENQGALIETLESYFDNGMNLRKTADALFVHKNSIIYRLTKIENLLGRKLSEKQVYFNLELCLKLRQLR